MSDCAICTSNSSFKLGGKAKFISSATVLSSTKVNIKTVGKLRTDKIDQLSFISGRLISSSKVGSNAQLGIYLDALDSDQNSKIVKSYTHVSGGLSTKFKSQSQFTNKYVDKIGGHLKQISAIKNFATIQKLYPVSDKITSLNNSYFINESLSSGNLYNSINEGIFTGNYNENLNTSRRISDDDISYIQPSSVYTSGTFRYKCEVSRPFHHPKNSFLFVRASAPLSNYGSEIAPQYKIHNIKFEDPSGNIIVKYKDITLRGDANYSVAPIVNYSTYISEPEINNANLNTWDNDYPILNQNSGYTLSMDFDVLCLDDPFSVHFGKGYEENFCNRDTLSQGNFLSPTNSIRISAIEICNSGDLCETCSFSGIKNENRFNFYTEVSLVGQRITRTIYPSQVLLNSFDINVYPDVISTWKSSPDDENNISYNTSVSGCNVLTSRIKDNIQSSFISLFGSTISDSGRLSLKFSHTQPPIKARFTNGAFDFSFDENQSFNRAIVENIADNDTFFTVDSIELRVVAKKEVGSRDYVLDVVGYSNDKLLNVTPKIVAFLQNKIETYYLTDQDNNIILTENQIPLSLTNEGDGIVPVVSGFKSKSDFGLSSSTLSENEQYYEKYLTSIDAGDHYKLSTLPVINSTSFKEYVIPLEIYEDRVDIGKSTDYSMSSYFENLYIDLYPIPSGASISDIKLIVYYKPSNGITLHTFGTPSVKELGRKDITLLPVGWNNSNDIKLNSDIDDGKLSLINGIPQGYSEPVTLKTNYARRWRGVDGNIVNGPYDPNQFDFSFYNPEANHPFLNGFYDFNNVSGNWLVSTDYAHSGYISSPQIYKNIGWRFNNNKLFNSSSLPYRSLDWTSNSDTLYGLISDSFDSAIKVGSNNGPLIFDNVYFASGLSVYIRYTPSNNIVGIGLTTLLHKDYVRLYLDSSSLKLSYDGEDIAELMTLNSSQYPLSLLFTCDSNSSLNTSKRFKIFARNEINNSIDLLYSSSALYDLPDISDQLIVGSSEGSLFIHEVGISNSGNIVESNPNRLFKQTTIQSFFDSHSHSFNQSSSNKFKLHSYVDDKVDDWKLGEFTNCSFSPAFNGFTTRIGTDYIIHSLKHNGSGYDQITNISLPSFASGLAYHTQIENDFLRFNLQDVPDANPQFYSAAPRISKNIPRGYSFKDNALSVETIVQHETNNRITWPNGEIGPKLIVSLYSKNKNPINRPSKVNWGLINRSIHYLKPSGCYEKLISTFNYDDLIDISEPWANFDLDNIKSEFDQKYYSDDINDMFVQYDLVYPSGSPFESSIKLHAVNVKLKDTLTYWADNNKQINLYASGESVRYSDINLFVHGLSYASGVPSGLSLCSIGSAWPASSGSFNLNISGVYGIPNNKFNLFVKNGGTIGRPNTFGSMPEIFGSEPETYPEMICYVSGGSPRREESMNFVMIDNSIDHTTYNALPIFLSNKVPQSYSDSLSLSLPISNPVVDFRRSESMGLVLSNNETIVYNSNATTNLFTQTDVEVYSSSGSFNLYLLNTFKNNQPDEKGVISWNKNNLGTSINAILDANVPYLEANDEIRGVDIMCYGDCESSNNCKENLILSHDLTFYEDNTCIEGGIFRAKNVYTNPNTSGFKTSTGYNNHFYGIRKYEGLVPNAPYSIKIKTKSGNSSTIKLPSKFTEINYGSNEYINYSGIKLVNDSDRATGNKYGKSVAVKKDLMAVGSPMQTVSYSEYDSSGNLVTINLQEAGTVYLYRRNPRPSGFSWPENEHRSDWVLENKLTLPSGLLKDYPTLTRTSSVGNITLPEAVTLRYWNVGQEGRQFGHSVDIGVNNSLKSFQEEKKEVIVVGGPSAKWSRNFEDLNASGVSIGLIVFTDEFSPLVPKIPINIFDPHKTYKDILDTIADKDLLFRYFCDPPIKFDVKVIICEPKANNTNYISPEFPEPKPNFITKKIIPRNQGIVDENDTLAVFSGIKSAFEETFPYDPTKLNNNIPVMLGVYVDNSRSLGRSAVTPGLDRFIEYFKQYSFDNGLKNFYNTPSSGSVYEYYSPIANSEDWISLSQIALTELLDTGRLVSSNDIRFLASGVGPQFFNANLSQFNYPPPSGGRVYVFEKESGVWNLIQEIKSPVVSYDTIDRFGHAVAISEDTNVIAIGSPYIEESCKIYEFKQEEKDRLMYSLSSWLPYKNSSLGGSSIRYSQLIEEYDNWVGLYGAQYANEILYSKLTSTEKFEARQYLNINEYQNIYTYGYNNIPYVGTWSFIPKRFAPSSRLGYSVAVNEDGSTVAFGAPTDSFNVFDDCNVYYKNDGYDDGTISTAITPAWSSNVNAGAVRLFESRRYNPHNSVVEFGKFGNLQESLNRPEDSGHFNYLSNIFADKNFRKMSESEVEIPKDAGLAFIITPGEDALSDEVVDNIISWLGLGDRNLVLVGNDPVWEENGIYSTSNNIINKLLERLDSNLRLHPARNQKESLPSGNSLVLPSFKPTGGTQTYINSFSLRTASGVADIRVHVPGYEKYMPACPTEADRKNGIPNVNYRCEMPLTHNGDLRAQWNEWCLIPYPPYIRIYPVNWPYVYGTYLVSECIAGGNSGTGAALEESVGNNIKNPGKDPIPLLVAAETKTVTKVRPAIPEIKTQFPNLKPIFGSRLIAKFMEDELSSTPSFIWDSNNPSGYSSYVTNVNQVENTTKWYSPEPVDNRTVLLQNKATGTTTSIIGSKLITSVAQFCVQQDFKSKTTSKIIAIASTDTESSSILSQGNDDNLNFYINMVSKNATGNSNIAQLGLWTGRQSFNAASSNGSILKDIFINTGNNVEENVANLEVFGSSSRFDVCWIANPLNIPSENEINELIAWLNIGNKKLIITHDSTIPQILKVNRILELLNSNIRSLYLPVKEIYPEVRSSNFTVNPLHPIAVGFNVPSYKIDTFYLFGGVKYIPFEHHPEVLSVGYSNVSPPIYDDNVLNVDYYRMNSGLDKVTFPAIPNSGYKIFITHVSEYPSENVPIDLYINNVSEYPDIEQTPFAGSTVIKEFDNEEYILSFNSFKQIISSPINEPTTISFNVQVAKNKDEIEICINALRPRIQDVDYIPKTPRLLAISGVPIPIQQFNVTGDLIGFEPDGFREVITQQGVPEQIITMNVDGAIASINDRHCKYNTCVANGFDGQLIEDGPVVAAQEVSFIAPFDAGVARSRITIISDSNLLQGRYMVDEFGRMSAETVGFIRSLYPETNFPSQNFGRQYTELTKIVSPERGSPQKYLSVINTSGIKSRFAPTNGSKTMSAFTDKESTYDPKYVKRTLEFWNDYPDNIKQLIINEHIEDFLDIQEDYGAFTMFSGIIDGKTYFDAGIQGGLPQIMKDTGSDYLDFDRFPSGYPGDLFGFSVSLHGNKLVVGSPFSAFSEDIVKPWSYHIGNNAQSGIRLSNNGGAGSVYVYEKTFKGSGVNNTFVPWEFTQKLRPNSINIGQDLADSGISQSYYNLGPNSYSNSYLAQFSTVTDQFGYDVSIDSDVIVVGSPGHDFGNYTNNIYNSGCFIRKSFNSEFDIPSRIVIDLGNSGVRYSLGSGHAVLNQGAIFAFENTYDWISQSKNWKLIEKIIPSGNANDNFGRSVYVHRSLRSDSDYVIAGGCENHDYSSSGTALLYGAGAIYANDIMLRESPPVKAHPNAYIDVKVFGEKLSSTNPVVRSITGNSILDKEFEASGLIYSDYRGSIFLEASGQDPSSTGFVQHRPYVVSIDGLYANGESLNDTIPFYIGGRNVDISGTMRLFTIATTGNVYNNLGLYTSSIVDFGSGILNFYTDCPDPTVIASGLNLMVSGIGMPTDKLNLRIRGY